MKVIVAVIVISSVILSCGRQTNPQPPSTQPPFTPTPPTSQINTPTSIATTTNEPTHDIYAGFTESNSMPFAMLHRSGENLFVTQDINSSTISGVVWNSADGKLLVVYSDSNGRPESVVIGNTIIQYSNYTTNTVDLTIIYPDGTRETLQANLNIDLQNKITAFSPASYELASYAKSTPRQSQQWLNYMKAGLFALGTASCVVTIYAPMYPLLLAPLAEACAGSLLTAVILAGNVANLDMADLQTFSDNWDIYMCNQGMDITACLSVLVTEAEKRKAEADTIKSNPPLPPATATPIPTNTPLSVSSLRGTVLELSSCRYGPGSPYLYKYGLYAGTRMEIIGRDADGDWLNIQGIGGHNPCWIAAKLMKVDGDVMGLPDAYPVSYQWTSDYFEPIKILGVSGGGGTVTVVWQKHIIRPDLATGEGIEYIVEVWTCVAGKPAFYAIGTNNTSATFQIDSSCGQNSHADVIGEDKHGFSLPGLIALP